MNGIIIDVKDETTAFSYCVSGVKHRDRHKYQEPYYFGSGGTYRVGYPERHHYIKLVVKFPGMPCQFVNVAQEALEINGRVKITNSFVEKLREKLKGKTIEFVFAKESMRYLVLDRDNLLIN